MATPPPDYNFGQDCGQEGLTCSYFAACPWNECMVHEETEDGPCEGCEGSRCDVCAHDDGREGYYPSPYEDDDGHDIDAGHYDRSYDLHFADPGGNSALRASGPGNPRNLPCPTCGAPNRLTPADRARGYQCDSCADRAERGFDY